MKKIKFPKSLEKGDNVYLLCPSSAMNPNNVDKCCEKIRQLGFNPIIGKSVLKNYGGYMAGKYQIRIEDIHEAFMRSDVKGIICMRGGFSSAQLLDKINYDLIKNNPKVFVGYSDVTNLHLAFNQICNLGTYHGPMVESNMIENFNDYTQKRFLNALKNRKYKYEEPKNKPLSILKCVNKVDVSGIITGGNLSLVASSLGTPYEIDTKNKILFLEDISEEIGRIDRMLTHLKYSGKFDDCSGVILGNFDDCSNTYDKKYDIYSLFKDFFKNYEKPVFYNFESGHSKPYLETIPLGAKCILDVSNTEIYFEKEEIL